MILAVPILLVCAAIWVKLLHISLVEGEELRAKSEKLIVKIEEVPAKRGNIFSADGKVMATSMPVYNVFMDPKSPSDKNFEAYVVALSAALAKVYTEKNARQWENYLRAKRNKGERYIPIARKQSFSDLQRIKAMPLYNLGKFKGGLIYEEINQRVQPLEMAGRTIGHDHDAAQAGIEGYFSSYLEGKPGRRMVQKISGGTVKPINDNSSIEPENGKDICITIDSRMQDVAHRALLQALTKYNAHHGCVVVMEVSTGRIKAMANLGKNEQGEYVEQRNYAVWENTEPGSTFKLAALMVALEDGKVDTSQIIDTENGIYTIYQKQVKDSNVKGGHGGYGKISLAEAIRKSSNTGIVKAIYPVYKDNPQAFVDRLYQMGLHQPTGINISGESKPTIPAPGQKGWSGISLPWMIFGYEVSFTPLQILNFYNAIANDGVMVKPQIVEEVKQYGRTIQTFQPEVINPAICSKETLKQLQALLLGVVESGTASNIKSPLLPMAGKTGTSRLNYWKGDKEYQASFAGYFPADAPKYSCIVVINNPSVSLGYYGNLVAAPVFRAVAEEVYLSLPSEVEATKQPFLAWENNQYITKCEQALSRSYLPSLQGLTAMEATTLLENYGVQVRIKGSGKVIGQNPPIGTALRKNMTVELILG